MSLHVLPAFAILFCSAWQSQPVLLLGNPFPFSAEPVSKKPFVGCCQDASERETIRELIVHIYRQHNPRKLDDVDGLMDEWAGEERLLLAKIKAKYAEA